MGCAVRKNIHYLDKDRVLLCLKHTNGWAVVSKTKYTHLADEIAELV